MPFADDLHLGGSGPHLVRPAAHHDRQQVPAVVGRQLEQTLVHRRQRHLASGGRCLPVRGRGPDGHAGLFAGLVNAAVGGDGYLQLMLAPAHADLGDAQFVCRLAQVRQRGWLNRSGSATHGQNRNEDIGCMAPLDGDVDHRLVSGYLPGPGLQNTLALDRYQRGRFPERHAHLKNGGFPGLVSLTLRNQVHPVVVRDLEPPVLGAGDPHRSVSKGGAAVRIPALDHQKDLPRKRRPRLAGHQAPGIGHALGERRDAFDLDGMVIAVKAAHQTLAVGHYLALERVDFNPRPANRLAGEVDDGSLKLEGVPRNRPAIRFDSDQIAGIPERDPAGNRLNLPIGVPEFHFRRQFLRNVRARQFRNNRSHPAT